MAARCAGRLIFFSASPVLAAGIPRRRRPVVTASHRRRRLAIAWGFRTVYHDLTDKYDQNSFGSLSANEEKHDEESRGKEHDTRGKYRDYRRAGRAAQKRAERRSCNFPARKTRRGGKRRQSITGPAILPWLEWKGYSRSVSRIQVARFLNFNNSCSATLLITAQMTNISFLKA